MKLKNFKRSALLVGTILLIGYSTPSFAQLGTIAGMAKGAVDASKDKKLEKSPAKDDILAAQDAVAALDNLFVSQNKKDSDFSKDKKGYDSFEQPYLALKNAIPAIKSKDPKWKTKDFEESEATYAPHFATIKKAYDATKAKNELISKLEAKSTSMPREYSYWGYDYPCLELSTKYTRNYTTKCPCGDQYFDYYTKVVNVKETRSLFKQLNEMFPESVGSSTKLQDIKTMYVDGFQKFKDDAFTKIDNYCTEVSANSGETEFEILVALDYFSSIAKTMLEIDEAPEARFTTLLSKIDKTKETVTAARLKRNQITEARKGKIFFTKGEIKREDFSDASVVTTVNYGDDINFRLFLAEPPINSYNKLPGIKVTSKDYDNVRGHVVTKIDGKEVFTYDYNIADADEELFRNGLTMRHTWSSKDYAYPEFLIATLPNMKAGNHKLSIEIFAADNGGKERIVSEKPVATGEITLVYGPTQRTKLLSSSDFCFPQGGMKNAAIEENAIALMKLQGWREQPQKAVILEKDWTVVRNKYTGIITKRFVNILIMSTRDGECIKQEFSYYQDNQGGNNYGPLYMSGIGSQDKISCECIK